MSRYALTFIEVRHPTMTPWQCDERSHSMVTLQKTELTAARLNVRARFFNCA